MLIASMQNITKQYAGFRILDEVSFKISSGEKIGLIGPNGCGKTTLLRILAGREVPDSGTVWIDAGSTIGYVPQHIEFEPDQTVNHVMLSEYYRIQDHLRECEAGLVHAGETDLVHRMRDYQQARDAFDHLGGETYAVRAVAMLDALGLKDKGDQDIRTLSGGEKNILAMACALMTEPDLLILDEPGNHLDYQGLDWLENFLNRFKGAVLMVSHNRYLLDHVVEGILDFQEGRLKYYDGGYTVYRGTRLQELLAQQSDYTANQKRLARLEALVKRFEQIARVNSDPAWGKRLRARRSQLKREKDQAIEKPVCERKPMELRLKTESSRANIAVRIRDYNKSFDSHVLFKNAQLDIACGEHVALAGLNGSGKTTLLKDIVSEGSWDNDVIQVGPSMRIGFCAQEQEVLNPESTLMEEILKAAPITRGEATAILLKFLFPYEHHSKRISDLSGGERNRLQLARLMLLKPNFLILDEPTNHLDIQAREVVEEALSDIDCTLLVVSHDRYFLDKIVDRVIEVSNEKLASYPGNFTEYWIVRRTLQPKISGRIQARRKEREKPVKSKTGGRAAELEERIGEMEDEIAALERHIGDAFRARDHQEGRRAANELKKLQSILRDLYDQWAEASGS